LDKNNIATLSETIKNTENKTTDTRNNKRKQLHPLIRYMVGKAVLLYGDSFAGKSTFIARLSRKLLEATGKPARLYWLDKNFTRRDFGTYLAELSGADIVMVKNPRTVHLMLKKEVKKGRNGVEYKPIDYSRYSMVAVDSLTGIATEMIKSGYPDDPTVTLATTRYAQSIMANLSEIAHEHNLIGILVAHPSTIWGDKWMGQNDKPSFMGKALMNTDIVIKFEKKNENERTVKVVLDRRPMFNESPWLNKEITTEELLE